MSNTDLQNFLLLLLLLLRNIVRLFALYVCTPLMEDK